MLLAQFQRIMPLRTLVLEAIFKSMHALNHPQFQTLTLFFFSVFSYFIFVQVRNLYPSTNFKLAEWNFFHTSLSVYFLCIIRKTLKGRKQINMEGGQSGTYLRQTRASSSPRVSVAKTYRDENETKMNISAQTQRPSSAVEFLYSTADYFSL